jgi:hypothetical protein
MAQKVLAGACLAQAAKIGLHVVDANWQAALAG